MDNLSPRSNTEELAVIARQLRLDILDMTTRVGSGHPSSSWSAVEIVTALYFDVILHHRPSEPWWAERDPFIMSKGHAAPLLYAALAHAGHFDREELWRLREIDSPVQGHPIQGGMPGVEATTGSLARGYRWVSATCLARWLTICTTGYTSSWGMENVRPGRPERRRWQLPISKAET